MGADESEGAEEGEDADQEETAGPEDPRGGRRPTMGGQPNLEMNVIGWIVFIGMIILLIPLLPAFLLAVILAKLFGYSGDRELSWVRLTGGQGARR